MLVQKQRRHAQPEIISSAWFGRLVSAARRDWQHLRCDVGVCANWELGWYCTYTQYLAISDVLLIMLYDTYLHTCILLHVVAGLIRR